MTKKWSWLNADKTEIVRTITNGDRFFSVVGGRKSSNFSDEFLLASGALPHIEPTVLWYQIKGPELIAAEFISYRVNTRPEEDIDATLVWEIEALGNAKIEAIASPPEKVARMIARGIQLERKERKYSLTAYEAVEADLLDAVNLACYNVRKAESDLIIETKAKTIEEKTTMPRTWAVDYVGWPA